MAESLWPLIIKTRLDLKINELTEQLLSNEIKEIHSNIERVTSIADAAFKNGNKKNACLVWNPRKKCDLAVSGDQTLSDDRSLDHAVMCCLKKTAEAQSAEDELLGKREEMADPDEYLCSGMHVYMYEEPCRLM